jgi:hypothetical protein
MSLPKIFASPEQAVAELGSAMQSGAFDRLVEVLEAYEYNILMVGIENPELTKDFLRGAVHASRSLRESLLSARKHYESQLRAEEAAVKARREFLAPGSGTGALS